MEHFESLDSITQESPSSTRWEVQFRYMQDFNDIIEIRHSSLLVHGINRVTHIKYAKYIFLAKQILKLFDKNALKYIRLTEFPYFDI